MDEQKPVAFYAPVIQPDGSILQTAFKVYEDALAACRKFEDDSYNRSMGAVGQERKTR
jgi:hypothetical protein